MDRPNPEGPGEPAPEQASPAGGTGNKRLRIVTRCGTIDEFFATFGGFADESSLFIVTNKPRALGLVQPFVIQLKDGTSIMRGEVEVVQSTTDGAGPEGRNGMRLKFLQADDGTREVLRRLLDYAHGKRSMAPPPGVPSVAPPGAPSFAPGAPPVPRDAETTKLSPTPSPAQPLPPGARPGPPAALSGGPSSTTQISPQVSGPSDVLPPGVPPAPPPVLPAGDAAAARAGSDPSAGERVPGAAYQLPANPFEGITAEALESFIECTLYEERMPRADEPPIETSVIFALPNAPASVYPPAAPGGLMPAAGMPAQLPAGVAPPPPSVGLTPPVPPTFSGSPAGPPTFGPAPGGSAAGASGGTPSSPGAPPPGVVRDAVLLAAAIQAASVPAAKARRPWIIGLTAVVSSIATLGGAYFLWGRSPDPPSVPTSVPSASVPPATAAPEKSAPPPPSAVPAASVTSAAALPHECRAIVRSYPQGAAVKWNDESLGLTPLALAAVPCGAARVTFQLRGFEVGERSANAIPGKNTGVFLRLAPVRIQVDVSSTPPGAQIVLNGRTLGRTPATVTMLGPNDGALLLRLAGYKSWRRDLPPDPPRLTVHADLEKN